MLGKLLFITGLCGLMGLSPSRAISGEETATATTSQPLTFTQVFRLQYEDANDNLPYQAGLYYYLDYIFKYTYSDSGLNMQVGLYDWEFTFQKNNYNYTFSPQRSPNYYYSYFVYGDENLDTSGDFNMPANFTAFSQYLIRNLKINFVKYDINNTVYLYTKFDLSGVDNDNIINTQQDIVLYASGYYSSSGASDEFDDITIQTGTDITDYIDNITTSTSDYVNFSNEDYSYLCQLKDSPQDMISQTYNEGYQAGRETGYSEGVAYAISQGSTATTIFAGIIDVALLPINFFLACLNFEVFGINIGAMVTATLTIAILVILFRTIFAGGNGGGDK